ncbi:MAG TPA: hypothetical protein VNL92_00590 [Dehalococcoidia bacterium]|nr:hypothetical protein [Dehalococcoidia bacterium]
MRGLAAALALVQFVLGAWLLTSGWDEGNASLPVIAGVAVVVGAVSTATGIAVARRHRRLAATMYLAGGLLGLPLVATLVYAPVPVLQIIFARHLVEHLRSGDDTDRRAGGHASAAGRVAIVLACLQILLGLLSIWNGIRDDPAPLTIFDYVRDDESDLHSSWPAVSIGLAIAGGGLLAIIGLYLAEREPQAGALLIALGALLGLGLVFFLIIVPLLLAAFGLSAAGAKDPALPVSRNSRLQSR